MLLAWLFFGRSRLANWKVSKMDLFDLCMSLDYFSWICLKSLEKNKK